MRSVHRLCLQVLGVPDVELAATTLAFASADQVRERAPKLVQAAETLDFKTLVPAAGGLFDYKLFGPGTVIDAPPVAADEVVKARRTHFARIRLGLPVPHPLVLEHTPDTLAELAGWTRADVERWLTGQTECELIAALESRGHGDLVMRELAVLPPDLRPLRRLDDDRWAISPLNEQYRRVIQRNQRFAHVVETNAPHVIIASERAQLHEAMYQLMQGELRELCGGNATSSAGDASSNAGDASSSAGDASRGADGIAAALRELDRRPAGPEPSGAIYRIEAALFALGFVTSAA